MFRGDDLVPRSVPLALLGHPGSSVPGVFPGVLACFPGSLPKVGRRFWPSGSFCFFAFSGLMARFLRGSGLGRSSVLVFGVGSRFGSCFWWGLVLVLVVLLSCISASLLA